MNQKVKFIVGGLLVVVVAVLGFIGGAYFKGNAVYNNKATNSSEEQKVEDLNLEKEISTENIEVAKEEVVEDVSKEEPTEEIETKGKIILSGSKTESGVKLSWTVNNLGSLDGFKLVKGKEANPVYPGSEYVYLTDKNTRTYSWEITTGSKYHFRVCQYVGGKCVRYSNDIILDTPEKSSEKESRDYASGVSLSVVKEGSKNYLKWSISGGGAPMGYKVVNSKDKNPEYKDGKYYRYISDGETKELKLEDFSSGDSYHFRVCIYKGGSCGAYSNDVSVSF